MSDAAQPSVSDFYDERWKGFHYANRLKCQRAAAILEALASTRLKEPRILDFGCGAGWLTNILSMFGPATGIELSPAAVETARQRYPHATFYSGDAKSWQSEHVFDVVVSQEVLEHFEQHEEFFNTVANLLRPGGILILTTPNAATLAAMPTRMRDEMAHQPVENPPTLKQLRSAAGKRFHIRRATSLIAGFDGGPVMYRVFNNTKVQRLLDACTWDGFGRQF